MPGRKNSHFNVLYRRIDGPTCIYCGERAQEHDHVWPLSAAACGTSSLLVPSCKECNLLAGDSVFLRLSDRRDFVRTKLRARYQRELSYALDIEDLLQEPDEVVRDTIVERLERLRLRHRLERRLTHQHSYDLHPPDRSPPVTEDRPSDGLRAPRWTRACQTCGRTIKYCSKSRYESVMKEGAPASCRSCTQAFRMHRRHVDPAASWDAWSSAFRVCKAHAP